ncbi:hypothetical protein LJC24_02110 [Desulfococcaceae bacterium OttesenSCG-928-F15]|nr:hypothetical protein [Desulfococcaceae bacterium OttesenSCG-928-F15]
MAYFLKSNGSVFQGNLPESEDDVEISFEEYELAVIGGSVNAQTIDDFIESYMNNFVKTRADGTPAYTSMASAISYRDCGDPQFEKEAEYCNRMRTQIWRTVADYLREVAMGIKEMPTTLEEVQALLPVLEWPE